MPDYTVPDRQLAELWRISDDVIAKLRDDCEAKRAEVAAWRPAPCPSREEFP
jgi:hypothetical protein